MGEHEEQAALMLWVRSGAVLDVFPELEFLYAIPNGGWRHKKVAAMMKREGLKPGVPDIHLPIARGGFHGLWIEMKYGKNKPTDNQKRWMKFLDSEGSRTAVCYSMEEAQQEIIHYLAGDEVQDGA